MSLVCCWRLPSFFSKVSKVLLILSFIVYFLYSQGLDPESLMFRDGRRRIDMVLAFEEEDYGVMTEAEARKRDHRKTFQVIYRHHLTIILLKLSTTSYVDLQHRIKMATVYTFFAI